MVLKIPMDFKGQLTVASPVPTAVCLGPPAPEQCEPDRTPQRSG